MKKTRAMFSLMLVLALVMPANARIFAQDASPTTNNDAAQQTAEVLVSQTESPEAYADSAPVDFGGVEAGIGADSMWSFFDRMAEEARLLITFDDLNEAALATLYSQERLEEIFQAGSDLKSDDLESALESYKNRKDTVNKNAQELSAGDQYEKMLMALIQENFLENLWIEKNIQPLFDDASSAESLKMIQAALNSETLSVAAMLSSADAPTVTDALQGMFEAGDAEQSEFTLFTKPGSEYSKLSGLLAASYLEKLSQTAGTFGSSDALEALGWAEQNVLKNFANLNASSAPELNAELKQYVQHVEDDAPSMILVLNKLKKNPPAELQSVNFSQLASLEMAKLVSELENASEETIESTLAVWAMSDTEGVQAAEDLKNMMKVLYTDSPANEAVGKYSQKLYEDVILVWREHGDEVMVLINKLDEPSGEDIARILEIYGVELTPEQIKKIDTCIASGLCDTAKDIYEIVEPMVGEDEAALVDMIFNDLMDGTLEDETKEEVASAFENRNKEEIQAALGNIDATVSPAQGMITILTLAGYPLTEEQKELITIVFTNMDTALTVENMAKVQDILDDENISPEEQDEILAWLETYDQSRTAGSLIEFYGVFGIVPELTPEQVLALSVMAKNIDELTTAEDIARVLAYAEDSELSDEEKAQIKSNMEAMDENTSSEELVAVMADILDLPDETAKILTEVAADIDNGYSAGEISDIVELYQENGEISDDVKEEQVQEIEDLLNALDEDIPLSYAVTQFLSAGGYDEYMDPEDVAAIEEFFAWADGAATVDSVLLAMETGLTDEQKQNIEDQMTALSDGVTVDWFSVLEAESGVELSPEEEAAIKAIIDDTMDEVMDCLAEKTCTWEDVLGNDPDSIVVLSQIIKGNYPESKYYNEELAKAAAIAYELLADEIQNLDNEELVLLYESYEDEWSTAMTASQTKALSAELSKEAASVAEAESEHQELVDSLAKAIMGNEQLSELLSSDDSEVQDVLNARGEDLDEYLNTVSELLNLQGSIENPEALKEEVRKALENPPQNLDAETIENYVNELDALKQSLTPEQQQMIESYQKKLEQNAVNEEGFEAIQKAIESYLKEDDSVSSGANTSGSDALQGGAGSTGTSSGSGTAAGTVESEKPATGVKLPETSSEDLPELPETKELPTR